MKARYIDATVGIFILAAFIAFLVLAFKVSGLTMHHEDDVYKVTADFDNIGGLKIRAPVTVAGVRIGKVSGIQLDPQTFKAIVTIQINKREKNIPSDSQAAIVTAGLLGANYVELRPGFEIGTLHEGSRISDTQPALQLETMIGQLLFNINKDTKES